VTRFIVSRTGFNAANQSSRSCPEKMPVWEGEARSAEDAIRIAQVVGGVTCYNNQRLSAVAADEVEAYRRTVQGAIDGFLATRVPAAFCVGTYRPNGGVATWQYYDIDADDADALADVTAQEWESAEVDGEVLKLFRHDGPVLHYQSLGPAEVTPA
jgi:hypothetical protein